MSDNLENIANKIHLLNIEIEELKQKRKPKNLIAEAELELKKLEDSLSPALRYALENLSKKEALN